MRSFPAPAKINLFLNITGRRDDGYHDLQTVFQFLDYCDNLQFEITDQPFIQLQPAIDGVAHDDNLIVRAATLLRQYADVKQGSKITLDKRLPIGGGLGGGSSNAATTLVALNELWDCQLSKQELAQLGLTLGADVPVFIHGQAAWAEGVGEKLTDISLSEPWYVVIVPDCKVATTDIFSSPELTPNCEPITISRFVAGEGSNVCEHIVRKAYPPVAAALDWLSQYAPSRMTGTGCCVFASFAQQSQAQTIANNLPPTWQGLVAKGCNQSPLYAIKKKP